MVVVFDKQSPPSGLHPYLQRTAARNGAGVLIACTVCLDTVHNAPWRTTTEVMARRAEFEARHRHNA